MVVGAGRVSVEWVVKVAAVAKRSRVNVSVLVVVAVVAWSVGLLLGGCEGSEEVVMLMFEPGGGEETSGDLMGGVRIEGEFVGLDAPGYDMVDLK